MTVFDPNGAVVPGATVEIKNLETNYTRTESTDENGRFVFLTLQPGKYSVSTSKSGFATSILKETALTVGQALPLRITLSVSDAREP